jgi:hypothetical protein
MTTAFTAAYALAALAGLAAAFCWFRLVRVHAEQTSKGGQPSWRYLPEAAAVTGVALLIASLTFLIGLL